MKEFKAEDKRIIRGETSNLLFPLKYKWAWDFFLRSQNNLWKPTKISMGDDVKCYNLELDEKEKALVVNTLAYLSTSDILAMRNIAVAIFEKITAPEVEQYAAMQIYEESNHNWTYTHVIETLGLDQQTIYNRHRVVPEIWAKIEYSNKILQGICDTPRELSTSASLKRFMEGYLFFALVFEGTWFYNGFSAIFALGRIGKMRNTVEQFRYILKDEVNHYSFGSRTIQTICDETGFRFDSDKVMKIFQESIALEEDYANYICPEPMLGYNATSHTEQSKFILNRRAKKLKRYGVPIPFPEVTEAPFTWLDEMANVNKEANFFESLVTEYQTNGLKWEESTKRLWE